MMSSILLKRLLGQARSLGAAGLTGSAGLGKSVFTTNGPKQGKLVFTYRPQQPTFDVKSHISPNVLARLLNSRLYAKNRCSNESGFAFCQSSKVNSWTDPIGTMASRLFRPFRPQPPQPKRPPRLPCEFCQSSQVNFFTGPLGTASADGSNFIRGVTFSPPPLESDTFVIHRKCIIWIREHHIFDPHYVLMDLLYFFPSPKCVVCRKEFAFLECRCCDNMYHLLCASKSGAKLNEYFCELICAWHPAMVPLQKPKAKESTPKPPPVLSSKGYLVPAKDLKARKKVMVMVWDYKIKHHGFVFHGPWIGEILNGQVVLLDNELEVPFRESLAYRRGTGMLDKLPSTSMDYLKTFWDCGTLHRPYGSSIEYPSFWIYQLVKHGMQDSEPMFVDYFERLVKLSQQFGSPDLSGVVKDLKESSPTYYHKSTDLAEAISNKFGKKANLTFGEDSDDTTIPWKLSFIYGEDGEKIDHPSPSSIEENDVFHF